MHQLTVSAPNPSIFRVNTVMNPNCIGRAVDKSGLSSSTGHIVQENRSSSLAKVCTWNCNSTCKEAAIMSILN